MEGRWLEGGSVVSRVGLLAVRKVEEGGTRMDVVRCLPSARGMMIGVVGINDDCNAARGRGMRPGDKAPVPRQ